MNRLLILIFILAILGIGGGTAWYLVESRNEALKDRIEAFPPPVLDSGRAIYTNGTYGFTVFYPESATVAHTFDLVSEAGTLWRTNALPDAIGMPVVAFVPYAITSEDSYPRSYTAMVRIGVSADAAEVARCTEAGRTDGETPLGTVAIGGQDWAAFSFESAGMMRYVRGVSYRTLFEDRCIAMEQIRTGSSYRDDAASEKDVPDAVLDAEYENLDAIVKSFTFVR